MKGQNLHSKASRSRFDEYLRKFRYEFVARGLFLRTEGKMIAKKDAIQEFVRKRKSQTLAVDATALRKRNLFTNEKWC